MNHKIGDLVGWSGNNSYTGIILDIYDAPDRPTGEKTIAICWIESQRQNPIYKLQHLPSDHRLIVKKEIK
mgnify:CR=1 FL=1|tara:strand:+ start:239 stop:448 length:210 start_codon:yes stop_codon:yes gene_type:complete